MSHSLLMTLSDCWQLLLSKGGRTDYMGQMPVLQQRSWTRLPVSPALTVANPILDEAGNPLGFVISHAKANTDP